jgi:hypothetical protein
MNVKITIERESYEFGDADGYRVRTSRNGNGYWAVGVPFRTEDAAQRVADAIAAEVEAQGDTVEVTR